jgi:hypothetical protein
MVGRKASRINLHALTSTALTAPPNCFQQDRQDKCPGFCWAALGGRDTLSSLTAHAALPAGLLCLLQLPWVLCLLCEWKTALSSHRLFPFLPAITLADVILPGALAKMLP